MQPSQLEQLLKFLTVTLEQGKDFTLEQAPQFVQELLMWRYYEALFFVGLGAAILLIGWFVFVVMRHFENEGMEWLPGLGGTVVGGLIIAINLHTAIQVKVAPRVVLVEMVRDLIAGQRR